MIVMFKLLVLVPKRGIYSKLVAIINKTIEILELVGKDLAPLKMKEGLPFKGVLTSL